MTRRHAAKATIYGKEIHPQYMKRAKTLLVATGCIAPVIVFITFLMEGAVTKAQLRV